MGRLARAALLAAAVLAWSGAGAQSARAEAIDRAEQVAVDGAELYLLTRGADARAPAVLWLHGGPGGAERPLFRYFNGALEDSFVVAYLDQRGAGRSFDDDADPKALTVARHLADLDTVVDHLRGELGREKIALLGHSWGAPLGLLYAQAHPEKVSAVVAVSPLVSMPAQQQAQYDFVLAEATRRGDTDALATLRRIGPPPHVTAEKAMDVEHIADEYGAVYHRQPAKTWVVVSGIFRGLATPFEIPRLIRGIHVSLEAMHAELLGLDLTKSVPSVDVPVIFILGRYDRHVSAEVAAAYFAALRAPAKQEIWFEQSAHNPPFEEPELFNETVARELGALGVAPLPH